MSISESLLTSIFAREFGPRELLSGGQHLGIAVKTHPSNSGILDFGSIACDELQIQNPLPPGNILLEK